MADSKDARLRRRFARTRYRVLYALGPKDEAAAILDRALAESRRLGMAGMAFELRLANVEAGRASSQQVAADAEQAGYLLVARKAR